MKIRTSLDETSDLKGRNNKFDVVISLVCA